MKRVFAKLVQYVNKKEETTYQDALKKAEEVLIRAVQRVHFQQEFAQLEAKEEVNKTSVIYNLNPMLDDNNIIRARTRLDRSGFLDEGLKWPIILPKGDKIVERMILSYHMANLHIGNETVLLQVRSKFIVIGGRREIHRCIKTCKKKLCRQPKPGEQFMSSLPKVRTEKSYGFTNVSLDYFGPMQVKEKNKVLKCWGCLFTCLNSRAVHLELVEDLTAEAFQRAFRRMMATRGKPTTIYSDNATTFRAADKELKELAKEVKKMRTKTEEFAKCQEIDWRFTTPLAPWTNGTSERMVRTVKQALRITLGQASISFRELETILKEVEAVVNKRPLAAVTEDELAPITPAELILGRPLDQITDCAPRTSVSKQWKIRKELLNKFWKRFIKDYLLAFQPRKKWQGRMVREPKVGDVVLLRGENVSRNEWVLARVLERIPSKDGVIRKLRLFRGPGKQEILRHMNHVAILEAEAEAGSKDSVEEAEY